MKWHALLLASGLILAACGDDDAQRGGLPDASTATLQVGPADRSVMIVNDQVVMQPYTAHIIDNSGVDIDVTAEATFSLSDADFGTFDGASLAVTGHGAGMVRVQATARGRTGDTGLEVKVQKVVVDPEVPDAQTLFDQATEDATLAPQIVYPSDKILVPPNLGQFDVHWQNNTGAGAANDLFEVKLANAYVDVRLYTSGIDPKNAAQRFWTIYEPDVWSPIASTRQQLTLTVAGLQRAAPTTKGTATSQQVDVTNEKSQGGIYYWTTSGQAGIWRYDVARPDVPPAPYFAADQRPASCMGCHVLSRDGTQMALTFDGGGGRATVLNVADRSVLVPFDGQTQPAMAWDFATFDAAATKLVTVSAGQMNLRKLDGTLLLPAALPTTKDGQSSTHPELSPDDTRLVNVEYAGGNDAQAYNGSLVVRSFDTQTNTFGAPTVLVPYDPGDGNNPPKACWYPSFSPDGQWIVFTRTTAYSYDDATAETWLVKADGSAPPVQLAVANLDATPRLTNSWARWVPFGQTFGPDNQKLFYLTFSSKRPFGVRIPSGNLPQIWMTPVFPDRAAAGADPSGNAFRVPFQDVTTANHIAQWTKAVVVQ